MAQTGAVTTAIEALGAPRSVLEERYELSRGMLTAAQLWVGPLL